MSFQPILAAKLSKMVMGRIFFQVEQYFRTVGAKTLQQYPEKPPFSLQNYIFYKFSVYSNLLVQAASWPNELGKTCFLPVLVILFPSYEDPF